MTEERRQAAGVERRILHAGAEELSERGIVGFKLRRVADRAGVAPATIYRYHNDRGELLLRAGRYLHEQEAQPLIAFAERDAARVQTVAEASAAIAVRTRDLLDPAMSTLCWRIAEFVALAPAEYVAGGQTTTSPLLNASCQMFTHVSQLTPFREGASPLGVCRFLGSEHFGNFLITDDERIDAASNDQVAEVLGAFVRKVFDPAPGGLSSASPMATIGAMQPHPPPGPTSRRQAIVRRAADLLGTDILNGFEVSDVAKGLGMPSNVVYRYFKTKEELASEAAILMMEDIFTPWTATMDALNGIFRDAGRKDLPLVFSHLAREWLAESSRAARLSLLRAHVFARASEPAYLPFRQRHRRAVADIVDAFEVLERRHLLAPDVSPAVAARTVFGTLFGQVVFDRTPAYEVPPDEWGSYFEILLDEVLLAPR